jgi:hypothetical protein
VQPSMHFFGRIVLLNLDDFDLEIKACTYTGNHLMASYINLAICDFDVTFIQLAEEWDC